GDTSPPDRVVDQHPVRELELREEAFSLFERRRDERPVGRLEDIEDHVGRRLARLEEGEVGSAVFSEGDHLPVEHPPFGETEGGYFGEALPQIQAASAPDPETGALGAGDTAIAVLFDFEPPLVVVECRRPRRGQHRQIGSVLAQSAPSSCRVRRLTNAPSRSVRVFIRAPTTLPTALGLPSTLRSSMVWRTS